MERLQKVIAQAGICSRRKAEELILAGKVAINGKICTELGTKVDENDIITIEGKKLASESKVYYLFNKPKNCVTTSSDDRNRPTIMNYLKDIDSRVFAVGRLDFDTTGALLITNDGDLANKLTHPRYEVEKVYRAKCLHRLTGKQLKKLEEGIFLDDGYVKAHWAKANNYDKINDISEVEICVHEGRKHMIKKMVDYLGSEVIELNRISFAGLTVGDLPIGGHRKLTEKEIQELKNR